MGVFFAILISSGSMLASSKFSGVYSGSGSVVGINPCTDRMVIRMMIRMKTTKEVLQGNRNVRTMFHTFCKLVGFL